MAPNPFGGRMPTPAELQQLKSRAAKGDQLAIHLLSVLDQMDAGGIPIGGAPTAPPGMKLVDMSTVKIHPLTCNACGSKLFEKQQFLETFYDENDPSHAWCGKPVMVNLCAKCGSEQVVTEIRRQSDNPKEPEVRYEYSTRTFKMGIQQIQQILAEQRVQLVNQIAEILDEHFGEDRKKEGYDLMVKIGTGLGLEQNPEAKESAERTLQPDAAAAPEAKPVPQPAPKSSIITEI